MADLLLDSDVVIWHLRGRPDVVELVKSLAGRARIGVSAITRAEVMVGARPSEFAATVSFLDACETLPVDASAADRAADLVRRQRARGRTLALPDAMIAASALVGDVPLFTCNARHLRVQGLDLREVPPGPSRPSNPPRTAP